MESQGTAQADQTVLLVDDNDSLRRTSRRLIARLGYRVLEAENAAAALDILAVEKVVLIVSDVRMPGELDGIGLARVALERWPDIKILLTSGYTEDHFPDLPSSVRALSKPFRADDFGRVIGEILNPG